MSRCVLGSGKSWRDENMASIRTARVHRVRHQGRAGRPRERRQRRQFRSTAATTQQQAVGDGASNQSDTAQVDGSEFTAVHQGNADTAIGFSPLGW